MEMSWNYLAAGRKDLCTGHGLLWRGGQAIKDLCTGQCCKLTWRAGIYSECKQKVPRANYAKKQNQCKQRIFIGLVAGKKTCVPAIARIPI